MANWVATCVVMKQWVMPFSSKYECKAARLSRMRSGIMYRVEPEMMEVYMSEAKASNPKLA